MESYESPLHLLLEKSQEEIREETSRVIPGRIYLGIRDRSPNRFQSMESLV